MAPKKTTTKKTAVKKATKPRVKKTPQIEAGKGEAVVFDMNGAKKGTVKLPENLFGVSWNPDLVHQVVVGMQANARPTTAHTKFRGEVRGGGKKPWKQKGTGRARHGSSRSPIWVGGGTTHGPRAERNYSVKINKKMRVQALLSLLSKKHKEGEVLFVEKLSFDAPKTKEAQGVLKALSKGAEAPGLLKKKNAAVITLVEKNAAVEKSFRNFGNVITEEVRNLNPVTLATKKYVVIADPESTFATLTNRLTK